MVIAELFAKLGLVVDGGSFAVANEGVQAVAAGASRATVALRGMGAAAKGAAASVAAAMGESEVAGLAGGLPVATGAHVPAVIPAAHGEAHAPAAHGGGGHGGGGKAHEAHGVLHGLAQDVERLGGKLGGGMYHSVEKLGAAFAGIWAIHELVHFTHGIIELGVRLEGIHKRTGVSAEAIQELGYAAKMSNSDVESLETGLKFLALNSSQAAKGSKTDAAAFRSLGVHVKDASGNVKSADTLLSEVADGMGTLKTDSDRTAAAIQIFGRSGAMLLPLLKRGSGGIAELREEAKKLGGGLSEHVIEQSEELEHELFRLEFAMTGVKSTIATALFPALEMLAHGFSRTVGWLKETAKHTAFFESALAVGLYASLAKVIPQLLALTAAQWKTAASAAANFAVYFLWAVALGAFVLVVDEFYNLVKGNKSVIGKWIEEWAGIGAVNEFVISWSTGIKALGDAFSGAIEGMWKFLDVSKEIRAMIEKPLDFSSWKNAVERVQDFMPQNIAINMAKKTGGVIAEGVTAYSKMFDKSDAFNRAKGQGMNADAISDVSVPRAVGRGINAGRQLGSAGFGQAARSSSILNQNVQQTNHTTIHTGADEHAVRKVVHEEHGKQNRNLRAALAPKHAEEGGHHE